MQVDMEEEKGEEVAAAKVEAVLVAGGRDSAEGRRGRKAASLIDTDRLCSSDFAGTVIQRDEGKAQNTNFFAVTLENYAQNVVCWDRHRQPSCKFLDLLRNGMRSHMLGACHHYMYVFTLQLQVGPELKYQCCRTT